MKKIRKYSFIFLILFIVVLQFIKPDTTNPSEDKTKFIGSYVQVPDNVLSKLEKACFDCHSNRTVWPWYSSISPVVYLIEHDVKDGRKKLNFSEWGNYEKKKILKKLEEISEEVTESEMPPGIYTLMHSDAKLTDEDKKSISDWAKATKENLSKQN